MTWSCAASSLSDLVGCSDPTGSGPAEPTPARPPEASGVRAAGPSRGQRALLMLKRFRNRSAQAWLGRPRQPRIRADPPAVACPRVCRAALLAILWFSGWPARAGAGILPGDADCNGSVDAADLAAVGAALFGDNDCAGADVNGDAVRTAADVSAT